MQISSRILSHVTAILEEIQHMARCQAASEAPEHAEVGPRNPANVDVKPAYRHVENREIESLTQKNAEQALEIARLKELVQASWSPACFAIWVEEQQRDPPIGGFDFQQGWEYAFQHLIERLLRMKWISS